MVTSRVPCCSRRDCSAVMRCSAVSGCQRCVAEEAEQGRRRHDGEESEPDHQTGEPGTIAGDDEGSGNGQRSRLDEHAHHAGARGIEPVEPPHDGRRGDVERCGVVATRPSTHRNDQEDRALPDLGLTAHRLRR